MVSVISRKRLFLLEQTRTSMPNLLSQFKTARKLIKMESSTSQWSSSPMLWRIRTHAHQEKRGIRHSNISKIGPNPRIMITRMSHPSLYSLITSRKIIRKKVSKTWLNQMISQWSLTSRKRLGLTGTQQQGRTRASWRPPTWTSSTTPQARKTWLATWMASLKKAPWHASLANWTRREL